MTKYSKIKIIRYCEKKEHEYDPKTDTVKYLELTDQNNI